VRKPAGIVFNEHTDEDLERIVSKRLRVALYRSGPSRNGSRSPEVPVAASTSCCLAGRPAKSEEHAIGEQSVAAKAVYCVCASTRCGYDRPPCRLYETDEHWKRLVPATDTTT